MGVRSGPYIVLAGGKTFLFEFIDSLLPCPSDAFHVCRRSFGSNLFDQLWISVVEVCSVAKKYAKAAIAQECLQELKGFLSFIFPANSQDHVRGKFKQLQRLSTSCFAASVDSPCSMSPSLSGVNHDLILSLH